MRQWVRVVVRLGWLQAWFAWAIAAYLRLALGTTRWRVEGGAHLALCLERPAVVAFWHENLPLMPALWVRVRVGRSGLRAHVLVSRHRDGRLIGAVLRRFRVVLVHGSSASGGQDRGGAAGLRALLAALAGGGHVVITPDGPRGPRRVTAAGVAQLAALAGVAVLPCGASTSRVRVLRSWDRMRLPLPFGRGVLVCEAPIRVARGEVAGALPGIAAALTRAADRAEAACG